MKRNIWSMVLLFVALFTAVEARSTWQNVEDLIGLEMPAEKQTIRVLLLQGVDKAQLETVGGYRIYNKLNETRITFGFIGKSAPIVPTNKGLGWGELFRGKYNLSFVPDETRYSIIVNGVEYRGRLNVYEINGKISIVNEVPVEDYLKSIMAVNFDNKLSEEVLASLAIIERTNAYYLMDRGQDADWDVDGRIVDYRGLSVTYNSAVANEIVEKTAGMIMVYEGDSPFPAMWTEHSAGKTAPYHVVFRKDIIAPEDVIETKYAAKDREYTAWSVPVKQTKLAEIADLEKVTDIALFVDKPSNKVYGVRIYDNEEYSDIDFIDLQNLLGKDQLKSSDFTAKLLEDKVVFLGHGRGPGVGLCLYSAKEMAREGDAADSILRSFFPYTKLAYVGNKNTVERSVE